MNINLMNINLMNINLMNISLTTIGLVNIGLGARHLKDSYIYEDNHLTITLTIGRWMVNLR